MAHSKVRNARVFHKAFALVCMFLVIFIFVFGDIFALALYLVSSGPSHSIMCSTLGCVLVLELECKVAQNSSLINFS